ncbi:putative low molecular weight protein-tyrosine-phosphatase slr0328 isoform X2 [Hibiscus syriacus]|uniref:putative low molecular weight protein-tyrosine-phosphatase slr0328 isoform X2 n=1 Tax=Hibiscus syriacus TaxID=106335 RepID=UPI001924DAD4|nr:putative low molecular weight protein-tyrosine-phosphatase slr0328 isoform X2 [Hibiscus syriacus]
MRPYLNNTTTRLPLTATPPYSPFCHHSHFLSSKTSSFIPLFHSTKYPSVQNPKSPPYPLQKPTNSPAFRPLLKASMASTAPSTGAATETKPFSVLFVCLGNICRSPAAEGVFRDIVKKKGLDSKFNIDSAGTINYHEGNMADPRMRAASKRRGIEITSISRPIRASDFSDFDLILAMDKQNREDILKAFNKWKSRDKLPADAYKKVSGILRVEIISELWGGFSIQIFVLVMQVRLMCSYCKKHNETEVPDPYYGGPQGFEKVLDLLEDACESLLDNILAEDGNTHSS